MEGRFLGVGLGNLMGIFFFCMLMSVMVKVIFSMYEITGFSEVVRTA